MNLKVHVSACVRKNMPGLGICFDSFIGTKVYQAPRWARITVIFIVFFWQLEIEEDVPYAEDDDEH